MDDENEIRTNIFKDMIALQEGSERYLHTRSRVTRRLISETIGIVGFANLANCIGGLLEIQGPIRTNEILLEFSAMLSAATEPKKKPPEPTDLASKKVQEGAVLDFPEPVGAPGVAGPRGTCRGPNGEAGPAGPTGPSGPVGSTDLASMKIEEGSVLESPVPLGPTGPVGPGPCPTGVTGPIGEPGYRPRETILGPTGPTSFPGPPGMPSAIMSQSAETGSLLEPEGPTGMAPWPLPPSGVPSGTTGPLGEPGLFWSKADEPK